MAKSGPKGPPKFDRLHFVLGQSDPGESAIAKDALNGRGIKHISESGASVERLFSALDSEIVDLIVCDVDMLRDRFVDVMQHIRKKARGMNPFVLIVAAVDDSRTETVRRLVKAGVDDLIRRPVTSQGLFESIDNLMESRKPFVVAHDYVGPTRRANGRGEGPGGTPLFETPNTMRSRAVDEVSEEELRQMVDAAVGDLRDKQLVAIGAQIDFVASKLAETYVAAQSAAERHAEVQAMLHKVAALGDDLRNRCRGTQFERIGDLASVMLALTQRIERTSIGRSTTEVQLLVRLARAIHRALAVERQSVDVMSEIADTIAKFTGLH